MPRGSYLDNHKTVVCRCGCTTFDLIRYDTEGWRIRTLECRNCKRSIAIPVRPVACECGG